LYNWPFQPFQVYKDFEYEIKTPQQGGRYTILFNGSSTTWAPISTSVIQSLVPPISNSISAQCCSDSGYGSGYIRPTGSSLTVGRIVYSAEMGSHDNNTVYNIELGINQGLDYYVEAGAGNGFHMEIFGFYIDNLR